MVAPGTFHTTMNYSGMFRGHKCNVSGYSELLVETKLATSGCLASVLSGKSYAKAIFAFKTVCLQQLLMEKVIEKVNAEDLNLVQDCSREKLDLVTEDDSASAFL